jgi:hypothetical protein
MRVCTLIELFRLTRAELFGLYRDIVNALAAMPDSDPERPIALPPRRRWRLSIDVTTGDMQDRPIPPIPQRLNTPRESADANTWMVSRRTAGIGARHAPLCNAGTSGIDRG